MTRDAAACTNNHVIRARWPICCHERHKSFYPDCVRAPNCCAAVVKKGSVQGIADHRPPWGRMLRFKAMICKDTITPEFNGVPQCGTTVQLYNCTHVMSVRHNIDTPTKWRQLKYPILQQQHRIELNEDIEYYINLCITAIQYNHQQNFYVLPP